MPDVKPGQIWKSWDVRYRDLEPGRLIRVEEVGETHADCVNISTGKSTKIKLSRFVPNSKGYKLVSEPEVVPAAPAIAGESEVSRKYGWAPFGGNESEVIEIPAKLPLRTRVANRRLRMAEREVARLEKVVRLRQQRGKGGISIQKGQARLLEAQKRLDALRDKAAA